MIQRNQARLAIADSAQAHPDASWKIQIRNRLAIHRARIGGGRMVEGATKAQRNRIARRVEMTHEMLSALPTAEDFAFLHSGLAQTCLPHSRPADDTGVWRRQSGRFSLLVQPGVIDDGKVARHVGVPYGSRARLIMLHLQSEGLKSRTVSLGPSLSAFLRSLGLPVSGGPRGSIVAIREQSLRIARCTMTMQWTDKNEAGDERTLIADTRIVDGMELWRSASGEEWCGTVELSERFHDHFANMRSLSTDAASRIWQVTRWA